MDVYKICAHCTAKFNKYCKFLSKSIVLVSYFISTQYNKLSRVTVSLNLLNPPKNRDLLK